MGAKRRSRPEIIARIKERGLIAILRFQRPEQVLPVTSALLSGGIEIIEVTMTVPGAISVAQQLRKEFGDGAVVGVGTVLGVAECKAALDAGAEFIVSPILRPALVAETHRQDKPVMLGAFTPTEAQLAHEAGADFVKIFPADTGGAAHIRALRAPLPHLQIVPTGGVDLNTAAEFIRAGCVALGVGSSLISGEILRDENWSELERRSREWASTVAQARQTCESDKQKGS